MSLTDDITIAQIAIADTQALVTLFNWVRDEIANRGQLSLIEQTAATQAAIKAADDAVDVNEDLKFPRSSG